jgi:hypothetical protein
LAELPLPVLLEGLAALADPLAHGEDHHQSQHGHRQEEAPDDGRTLGQQDEAEDGAGPDDEQADRQHAA